MVLAGEITTNAHVDYIQVARDTIKRIGYDNTEYGIDYKGCAVLVAYDKQSNDIAQGVDHASDDHLNTGRRRPGPDVRLRLRRNARADAAPIYYAHRLVERQAQLRKDGRLPFLRPGRQEPGDHALCGRQAPQHRHRGAVHPAQPRDEPGDKMTPAFIEAVIEEIIKPVLPKEWLQNTRYLINPTGRFVVGGPRATAA